MIRNKKLTFIAYRYKFLFLYILFGGTSIVVELLISTTIQALGFPRYSSMFVGFILGLLTAFILNIKFNFHIVPSKRRKALFYFAIISFASFFIQLIIRIPFRSFFINEDITRFLTAGIFFLFSYMLHRKFSFKEYKKVGIAIYADGVEDIRKIFEKIRCVSDFIHIDIVDKSFKPDCADVKAYRAEAVRAYWQDKQIEAHIMSREPSRWLSELQGYVDVIYIHTNIDEDVFQIWESIRKIGSTPGIVITADDDLTSINPFLKEINHVLILAVSNPGISGQQFDMRVLDIINTLALHPLRSKFTVCVDGGVNESTIKYLNSEAVVSGSFVLNALDPIKNIMLLQTSGEYEKF